MPEASADRAELTRELAAARELTAQLGALLETALNRLSPGVEEAVQPRSRALLIGVRPGDWRGTGRRGRPSKLDTDPELNAFIRARIEDMTFAQLADAVAERFPPGRRTSTSALHRWWLRERAEARRAEAKGA